MLYTSHMIRLLAISLFLSACGAATEEPKTPQEPVDWMAQHADSYLEDQSFRRAALEDSLWMPELPYARKRLEAYALPNMGWDFLPEMSFEVERVGENPRTISFEKAKPTTQDEWLELGERVFWDMPMRRDTYLEWLAERPETWESYGIEADAEGNMRGVVRFVDVTGNERMGITCGACHGANGTAGQANHKIDLGKARHDFGQWVGRDFSEGLGWGPGAVDVTDDFVDDPLTIPHLWGLDKQTHINKSGAIELSSPTALAIRFETQYIEGHAMMARPSRTLTWALAMYVYSLEHEPKADAETEGEAVFTANCASCHVPDRGYSGGLIDAQGLNANPMATESGSRGTGFFKIPSLIGVSDSERLFSDGSATNLDEALLGGHPNGQVLKEREREELIKFLNTL